MQQVKFREGNVECLVVEVPMDAFNFKISKGYLWYDTPTFENVIGFNFTISFHGNWQLLGNPLAIEEADCVPLVEHKEIEGSNYHGLVYYNIYRNYKESKEYYDLSCDQFETAKQSLLSRLESLGPVLVNPYGQEPKSDYTPVGFWNEGCIDEKHNELYGEWLHAQSKLTNCVLLVREVGNG